MDDIVLRGMAKWPNVPAVYGWLALDRRGQWLIRGSPVSHPVVREFIGRNYTHDAEGRWFFQNGPQRVFVELHYTPLVFRIASPDGTPLAVESHHGVRANHARAAWLDENGAAIVETAHGVGVIDDRDLDRLLPHFADAAGTALDDDALARRMELLGQGRAAALALHFGAELIALSPIDSRDVPQRFGFVACPQPPAGVEACA